MPRPVSNPPNPWASSYVEYLDEPPAATLSVFEEEASSIITENDSPDIAFRFSVNPYRGCMHACAYCYARPTHQYLGFGAGTDFERKIVVKINAADLLHRELLRPSWAGASITFSGNTDCYQPLEASYGDHPGVPRCLRGIPESREHHHEGGPHPPRSGPAHRPKPPRQCLRQFQHRLRTRRHGEKARPLRESAIAPLRCGASPVATRQFPRGF